MTFESSKKLLAIAVLFIIGMIAFFPCLNNGFTNWDDSAQILSNPLVRRLSWKDAVTIFKSRVVSEYHPLVTLIFAIEYRFFGAQPFPYHFHSLLLHLLNAVLVFFVLLKVGRKMPVAFIGALLFEIHPFQVQVVAWISARKDLLFACFYLVSFLFYCSFQSGGKKRFYFLALLFFIASLLSKTLAVTLPLIFLLWLYTEGKSIGKKEVAGVLPFLILSLAAGFFAFRMQVARGPGSAAHLGINFENVILAFRNLKFYFLHLLLPINLSPMYIFPERIDFWQLISLFSLFLIIPLFLWFYLYRREKRLIWGAGFFIIILFPVLRLVPFAGVESAAHRFLYLPSAGIFYLIGWIFYRLIEAGKMEKAAGLVALIVLATCLAVLSNRRCPLWKDSPALWEEVMRKQGESELFYHMLADHHFHSGRPEKAIELCNESILYNPAMAYSYLLKSRAQLLLGNKEEAKMTFQRYIEVLNKLGRGEQARRLAEELKIRFEETPDGEVPEGPR